MTKRKFVSIGPGFQLESHIPNMHTSHKVIENMATLNGVESTAILLTSGLQSGRMHWMLLVRELDSPTYYKEGYARSPKSLERKVNKAFKKLTKHWEESFLPPKELSKMKKKKLRKAEEKARRDFINAN